MTDEVVIQVRELVARAEGELFVLDATPIDDDTNLRLEESYTAAVEDEWQEFLDECDKYGAEIEKEIQIEKFTLAELEEEEQSLDRLRRWHRALGLRDHFGATSATIATDRLRECVAQLEMYATLVYETLGQ